MINKLLNVTFVDVNGKSYTTNNGFGLTQDGDKFSVWVKADKDIKLKAIRMSFTPHPLMKEKMIANGYQSWTETKRYGEGDRMKPLKKLGNLLNLNKYGDYHFYNASNKVNDIFSHEFTVFSGRNDFLMVASLNQGRFFTVIERHYKNDTFIIHLDVEGLALNFDEIFDAGTYYMASAETESILYDGFATYVTGNRTSGDICNGWTSWYNYYTHITQDIITHNIQALEESPIDFNVFQIDDGYQKHVGDWLNTNHKFEDDLLPIANEAIEKGMKPGLWLAPFICEKESFIYTEKKEWLLKGDNGKPIIAGFNPGWSGFFYALDIYNEDVRNYLKSVFSKVFDEWSFKLVKLDFLYAVCLLPRAGKTRAMVMKDAMDFLDEVCKGEILGCGIPIASALLNVEYCRIGADVSPYWEDKKLRFAGYRERVSTRAAIYNTLNRYGLNRRFFSNDPDVFIIREEDNKLSADEKYTLFMVNQLLGDLVFFSDDISRYEKELVMIQSANPIPKPENVVITEQDDVYQIDFHVHNHSYVAYINMSDVSKTIALDEPYYFSQKTGFLMGNNPLVIKPHESYLLYYFNDDSVDLLGIDDGYILPAEVIKMITTDEGEINYSIEKGYRGLGRRYVVSRKPITSNAFDILNHKQLGPYNIYEVN